MAVKYAESKRLPLSAPVGMTSRGMDGMEDTAFIAYRVGGFAMKLVPAPRRREWVERTTERFAERCLPMQIANQAGWAVLNDRPFRAIWLGENGPDSVVVDHVGSPPFAAISHFGHGILTFTLPFLFRTPPSVIMLMRGLPNAPKDGIYPLEGLVETDWAVATAAMSWRFTRPAQWITFERDEPICMVVPMRVDLLENAVPRVRDIRMEPDMNKKYQAWLRSRNTFNEKVRQRDPAALAEGWQRHYFQGAAPAPENDPPPIATVHRTHLKLRPFARAEEAATDSRDQSV